MAKHKSETQKTEKPTPSTSRTYRKSPARLEKPKSPASSPIRSSSRRSPARKSPARRSPSRRSPSRKSPSRRSPGRSSPTNKGSVPKSPTRRNVTNKRTATRETKNIKDVKKMPLSAASQKRNVDDSESDGIDKQIIEEKPKAAVRGRSRRLESGYSLPRDIQVVPERTSDVKESQTRLLRRSIRKSLSRDKDSVTNLEHSNLQFKKLTEFSDDDEKVQFPFARDTSERCSEPKVLVEHFSNYTFGGWVAILTCIIILPLFLMGLNIICGKTQCSYTSIDNFWMHKTLSHFIDSQSFLLVSAFVLLMAILQVFPFGGAKVTGLPNRHGRLDYITNSFFTIIFTSATIIALECFNVPITSYIITKYFQLFLSSLILGIILAIYVYIRSFYVPVSALNLYGTTKSELYNFWVGREVNPRPLGIFDIKMFLIKVITTGSVIINGAYIYHTIKPQPFKMDIYNIIDIIKSANFNTNLIILGIMQIFYALDLAIFEYALLTGHRIQYEGVGYLTCVRSMTAPFLSSLITKYIYEHNENLKIWQCISSLLLFIIGYVLYRRSNLEKHAFRENPYNPALSHLKTIPTSRSKKLLVSGYWGFLRHPNYLGDILIHLSFSLFAWNVPAALDNYGTIIFLIYRASMDVKECKQKYGGAWNRYCQRVKYVLFPGIY